MANILNKGRCSRCIASKKGIIDSIIQEKIENELKKGEVTLFCKSKYWLYCLKYKKFCASVAGFLCKESPMGMSANDYKQLNLHETGR